MVTFLTEDKLNRHRPVRAGTRGSRRELPAYTGYSLESVVRGGAENVVWVWLPEHWLLPVEQRLMEGKRHLLTFPPEGFPSRKHSLSVTSFRCPVAVETGLRAPSVDWKK